MCACLVFCVTPADTEVSFLVLSLWQPSGFSSLTSIFLLPSFNNLLFLFFLSLFPLPYLNLCHFFSLSSSSFQNIIGKDIREQLLLSRDKTLITLPLLGKPPWLDSSEVFHPFLKHTPYTNLSNIMKSSPWHFITQFKNNNLFILNPVVNDSFLWQGLKILYARIYLIFHLKATFIECVRGAELLI